jgi:glutamate racemase
MIGVFDSGSGGLTVLKAVRELLPSSDYLYFGDIKNAPYGSRSREELTALTVEAIRFLQANGATSIVSACNSVSASLAVSLYDAFDISPQHLVEMVGPTVAYFRNSSARLMLCATPATIQSGIYQNGFRMIGKEIDVVPIPELAGLIEFGEPKEKILRAIAASFAGKDVSQFDALVLACTHYPLVPEAFIEVLGGGIHLFDPAVAVSERVERHCWPREAGEGKMRFVITKDSVPFRKLVSELFTEEENHIEVA